MANGTEDEGFSEADDGTRLDRLEGKVDKLADMLAKLVPSGSHADAQARTERRLDRPSTVEEQVRAELAKARADQERAEQEQAAKAEQETVAQRLARLEEVKPEPPERRSTRVMWGSTR
jgi:flagellar motility protein MotE (MotC chaperone)